MKKNYNSIIKQILLLFFFAFLFVINIVIVIVIVVAFIFCYKYCCRLFLKKDSNEFLDEIQISDDNIYQSGLNQNKSPFEAEININQN